MRRTKAFTLVELLVVVAIIAILASLLLPSLGRARELARQATCTANLNTVGKAMALYIGDEDDKTPRLSNDDDPISGTLAGAANTYDNIFSEGGTSTDNSPTMADVAMQNVWLMIKKGNVTEEAFHCQSDTNWKPRSENAKRYGWEYKNNFSYGMHWPYEMQGTTRNPAAMNTQMDGGVVIFADQNPGTILETPTAKPVTSATGSVVAPSNHTKDGEAVLDMNGSTSFFKVLDEEEGDKPKHSEAGKNGDEIYISNGGAGTIPQDGTGTPKPPGEWDTYIVETKGSNSP